MNGRGGIGKREGMGGENVDHVNNETMTCYYLLLILHKKFA